MYILSYYLLNYLFIYVAIFEFIFICIIFIMWFMSINMYFCTSVPLVLVWLVLPLLRPCSLDDQAMDAIFSVSDQRIQAPMGSRASGFRV